MKAIIFVLTFILSFTAQASDHEPIGDDVTESIATSCRTGSGFYFDIHQDVDLDEPTDPNASEDNCVLALSQVDGEVLETLLNDDQLDWYLDKVQDLLDRSFTDETNSVLGRIHIDYDNSADRPDFS